MRVNGLCEPGLVCGQRHRGRISCSKVEQCHRRERILFIRNAAEAILGKQVVDGFYQESLGRPVLLDSEQFELLRGFGDDMRGAFEGMGGYTGYFFVLGLVLFSAAAYYSAIYITKVREFARLVRTESKSDFIRLQDKIERLAFELGSREQAEVAARKREFRIRH